MDFCILIGGYFNNFCWSERFCYIFKQTLQNNLIKRLCVGVVEGGGRENFLLGLGGAEQKRLRTPDLFLHGASDLYCSIFLVVSCVDIINDCFLCVLGPGCFPFFP